MTLRSGDPLSGAQGEAGPGPWGPRQRRQSAAPEALAPPARRPRSADEAQKLERLFGEILTFSAPVEDAWRLNELKSTLLPHAQKADQAFVSMALQFEHEHAEVRPENVFLATRSDDPHALTTLALVTDKGTQQPLAMFIATVSGTGEARQNYLNYIVVDTTSKHVKGINEAILAKSRDIAKRFDAKSETLEASWIGRLVWAQRGYDFSTEAERTHFRDQFDRFIEHYQLDPALLRFRREDGTVEPFDRSKLQHPWDYSQVFSLTGPVVGDVLAGQRRLDKGVEMDVGRAFLLGNEGDPVQSRYVAPDWHGIRPLSGQGPGWEQLRAYTARTQRTVAAPEPEKGPR